MLIGNRKQVEDGTARKATTEELRALFPWASEDFFAANDKDMNEQPPVVTVASPQRAKAVKGTGQNKYHAQPTEYGGRRYASKKEARHAEYLDLLKSQDIILSWVPQVPFPLPGGATHKVDFLVWYPPIEPGGMPFAGLQEVKGRDLAMGKLKRKQLEEIYRLKVEVI